VCLLLKTTSSKGACDERELTNNTIDGQKLMTRYGSYRNDVLTVVPMIPGNVELKEIRKFVADILAVYCRSED
jgi:hypothetical protein